MTLAEYFEKRFRRQHGGLLDVDGIGVVGESGDGELVLWNGELVLWKSMSARANVRSGVRIATSELPLRVDAVGKSGFLLIVTVFRLRCIGSCY